MELATLLATARQNGASDIHLTENEGGHLRIDGRLHPLEGFPSATAILGTLLDQAGRDRLDREGEADVAFDDTGGRVRLRASRARRGVSLFLRLLPDHPPQLETLPMAAPARAALGALCALREGLILVVGASGSGKSTSTAALVDQINRTGGRHVLTVEDPVEYLHHPLGGPVTQREVGRDTPSVRAALEAALRADPDVILVGEIRERAVMEQALGAAETGHLVLATLHASSAPGAVDRIIDLFPLDRRDMVRDALAGSLAAVLHQRLAPLSTGGRVAVCSLLRATPAARAAIREGRTQELHPLMAAGANKGMVTEDACLDALYLDGLSLE